MPTQVDLMCRGFGGGEPFRGLELEWNGVDSDAIINAGSKPSLVARNTADETIDFDLTVSWGSYDRESTHQFPPQTLKPGGELSLSVPVGISQPSQRLSEQLRARAVTYVAGVRQGVSDAAPAYFHYEPHARNFVVYGEDALADVFSGGLSLHPSDEKVAGSFSFVVVESETPRTGEP